MMYVPVLYCILPGLSLVGMTGAALGTWTPPQSWTSRMERKGPGHEIRVDGELYTRHHHLRVKDLFYLPAEVIHKVS